MADPKYHCLSPLQKYSKIKPELTKTMKLTLVLFYPLVAAVPTAILEPRQGKALCKKYDYWSGKYGPRYSLPPLSMDSVKLGSSLNLLVHYP